jgi:hypothetical protein
MPGTQEQFLVSEERSSLSAMTTNLRARVRIIPVINTLCILTFVSSAEKQRIAAAGGYVEYGRVNGQCCESIRESF